MYRLARVLYRYYVLYNVHMYKRKMNAMKHLNTDTDSSSRRSKDTQGRLRLPKMELDLLLT